MEFLHDQFPDDIVWYSEFLPPARESAFVPYRENSVSCTNNGTCNINKRILGFLSRSSISTTSAKTGVDQIKQEHEKERCFRHMMNERTRREKQKQSYMGLHSMLPTGTKNDKNSIVEAAASKIQLLQRCEERLRRRKVELEAVLARNEKEMTMIKAGGGTNIKVKVAHPTSGVDSMVEVLNCLKRLGLKARTIRSVFSKEEFSAELELESKVGAAEIEEALQLSLYETELRLRSHF
ncbi:hypothetical protein TIFTF001_022642 [Ficus carica]|uniref:BHLH domain-containing protein n=1 Tax=Ficus carica TaxID=3494 RepID=A0AA88AKC6_FICCA|nr:hypothetical protein TIFTF001_022642 [Ficus carica]